MKHIFGVLLLAVIFSGCANSTRIVQGAQYKNISISEDATIYVSVPKDGRYGEKVYSGSGLSITSIVKSSLLRHATDVSEGGSYESYKKSILSAKEEGSDYLFYLSILHWEDRATEWSGIPDKVEIKITVVNLKTNSKISSVTINGSSGIATLGGDHPQDLLPPPVNEYIESLFK